LEDQDILLREPRITFSSLLAAVVNEIQVLMEVLLGYLTKLKRTECFFRMYCLQIVLVHSIPNRLFPGQHLALEERCLSHQLAKPSGHHKRSSTARVSSGWLRAARALPHSPELFGSSLTPKCTSA